MSQQTETLIQPPEKVIPNDFRVYHMFCLTTSLLFVILIVSLIKKG